MFILKVSISLIIFTILFFTNISFIKPESTYGLISNKWVYVKPSENGLQAYDINSIKRIDSSNISLLSKYMPKGSEETITYKMNINCSKRLFQDVSINGINVSQPLWQDAHGDSLIVQLLNQSCNYLTD